MKNFKKLIPLLCCFTMLCFPCQAETSPPQFDIKTTTDSITTDETFYLLVELKDNVGFGALQFSIEYDKDKLLLESVSSGELLPQGIIASINTDINGEINFSAISIQNIEGNGTLLVSKFKAKDAGTAKFDFKLLAYADSDGVSLNSTTNDTEIVIEETLDAEIPDETLPEEEKPGEEDFSQESTLPSKPSGGTHSGNSPNKNKEEQTEEKPVVQEKEKISFADVSETHWAYNQIYKVAEMGLFSGTGKDAFSPELPMTRAMFVTVLYRYAGSPALVGDDDHIVLQFTDLEDSWYTDAVSWAAQNGIVSGTGDNLFSPHDYITRGEISTILCRYKNGKSMDINSINSFNDSVQIPDWGKEPVAWAIEQGLIMGRQGGIIAFSDNATRAETAVIFTRFLNIR